MQNFRVLASILTEISNFLPDTAREPESQTDSQPDRQGNDQGVELRICPKGKGGANYRAGRWRRMVVTL